MRDHKWIGAALIVAGTLVMVVGLVMGSLRDGNPKLVPATEDVVQDPSSCTSAGDPARCRAGQNGGAWDIPPKTTVHRVARNCVPPDVPVLAMLLILIGIPLRFDSLLKDDEVFSSMRFVMYILAGIFTLMLVKTGWNATSIGDIKVDPSWTALLSSALVSKAAQSFSENGPRRAATGGAKPAPPDSAGAVVPAAVQKQG